LGEKDKAGTIVLGGERYKSTRCLETVKSLQGGSRILHAGEIFENAMPTNPPGVNTNTVNVHPRAALA